MIRQHVAIVDYGLGNQVSVQRLIQGLGHRCVITSDKMSIATADLAILPGVGAFPVAMHRLHQQKLIPVLVERAQCDAPILGICLGMQLLTECSEELGITEGLGFIPGQIKPLTDVRWHIGWNTLDVMPQETLLAPFNGQAFYFNHSYAYSGPMEWVSARAKIGQWIPAVIRRGRIVGVQFHPEKSQEIGRQFFSTLMNSLCAKVK